MSFLANLPSKNFAANLLAMRYCRLSLMGIIWAIEAGTSTVDNCAETIIDAATAQTKERNNKGHEIAGNLTKQMLMGQSLNMHTMRDLFDKVLTYRRQRRSSCKLWLAPDMHRPSLVMIVCVPLARGVCLYQQE